MNKEMRLQLIKKLVTSQEIKTQDELVHLLIEKGFDVTQATISRDIRTLQLIKVPTGNEGFKYSFKGEDHFYSLDKFQRKIKDAMTHIECIDNFVLLKTLPGHAHSFGVFLDAIELNGKAGTICGNDTCLIICRDRSSAEAIKQQIEKYQESEPTL